MINQLLLTALLMSGIQAVAFGQVYTFDFFAHNSYQNENPGEIIVLNDQWQESITYTGSGDGYHVRYIIDVNQATFETIICDRGGSVLGEDYTLEHISVLTSGPDLLHLFNPGSKKTSLFYIGLNGEPTFVVEDADGKGTFSIEEDFTYAIH